MKKVILSLLLVVAMAATFTACGKKNDAQDNNTATQTPAPTEEPEVEEPSTDVPSEDNGTGEVSETLNAIHEAVKDAYGEAYIPNMPIDAATLEEQYGLNPDWYTSIVAEGPMISMHVDKFIAVEAKEGNVKDVEKALNAYRDNLLADTMQYPINVPKIQASRVEVIDNYVFFILLGEIPMEVEEKGDEAMLEVAKEQNQIAVDAIKSALGK